MEADTKLFIQNIPKVELHLHLEGTLEPSMLLSLAKRNGVALPYEATETTSSIAKAYKFTNLQSFLNLYYMGCTVLLQRQDFYDLTMAYLTRAHDENVRHVELFFDPQAHTARGVPFDDVVDGIHSALVDGQKDYGITSKLIMCILRDQSEEDGMKALDAALRHKDKIAGVGLDSAEIGNPPSKFQRLFQRARKEGFFAVAHAGEEGPPKPYVWDALDKLGVNRIDHGVRCEEDDELVERLIKDRIPLNVCPISNVKLKVFDTIQDHNLKRMLDRGLLVTVNSDDPAYFGGYITKNFTEAARNLCLKKADIIQLTKNAIEASALGAQGKARLSEELESFLNAT